MGWSQNSQIKFERLQWCIYTCYNNNFAGLLKCFSTVAFNVINIFLTCSEILIISTSLGRGAFAITDTTLLVSLVILSTQDNTKLIKQLKTRFQIIVNWKKYTWHVEQKNPNQQLNNL